MHGLLVLATSVILQSAAEDALRYQVGLVALAQVKKLDVRWQPQQRDCAGLIRFSYKSAFSSLEPAHGELWLDAAGKPSAFADAATLLQRSFVSVGRNPAVMELLKTGDVLAFRQAQSGVDTFAAPYHLMMVVRPGGADRHQLVVIYHTGDADQGVRAGSLREYLTGAPAEWQPAETNPSFLGFYRFKGWVHD